MLAIVLSSGYMHTHYFLWVLPGLLLASDAFLLLLAGPYLVLLPFMQVIRVSGIGLSTPFRLTATLQLLVLACWIAGAWRLRATRAPQCDRIHRVRPA
jgi:hypothetical protein